MGNSGSASKPRGGAGAAESMYRRAVALSEQRRFRDAHTLFVRAIEAAKKEGNQTLEATAEMSAGMAIEAANKVTRNGAVVPTEEFKRDMEVALQHYKRSLQIRQATLGPSSELVAGALVAVSRAQNFLGETAAAAETMHRAVQAVDAVRGAGHADAADVRLRYAAMLSVNGRWQEALEQCQTAVGICEAACGEAHPKVAAALQETAICLAKLERHQESLDANLRALAMREKALRERNGEYGVLAWQSAMAAAEQLQRLGRVAEAQAMFEKAAELSAAAGQPPEHAGKLRARARAIVA
ncbi:unnamed protein product [Pedinophyceae sp. YPF-701]|nr:unnamed protein product [Pedinophyceae sp. YPF-701]